MRRPLVLLITSIGCYHPVVPEGAPCASDLECPPPQICEVGRCRLPTLHDAVPHDTGLDAAIDGSMIDAAVPGCAQANLGPFATPTQIASLATPGTDGTATVTHDQLEMYFKSNRLSGGFVFKIFRTSRPSLLSAWSPPDLVLELASTASEGSPDLSADRLTIYFSSTRPGGLGGDDIWRATRPTVSSMWSAPVHVPELSSPQYEEGFTVLPSGLVGYLHSNRGTGGTRLFRTTRTSTSAAWTTPIQVAELDGNNQDQNPTVTPDDCTIYFQSNRTGAQGSDDLWLSRRTTPTGTWSAPERIPSLSTANFDGDPWISADQRTIVFTTGADFDDFDLYEARR